MQRRPEEADELARDGDDRDLRLLAIREMRVALMQSVLRLPGVRNHRRRLARLAPLEIRR